jgi:hypothetical protein
MYEDRGPLKRTEELDQGDLLRGILRVPSAVARNFGRLRGGNKFRYPAVPQDIFDVDPELRVVLTPIKEDLCIVLSNSCDNFSGKLPVLLAPAIPFEFQGDTPKKKWEEISLAATGTANPKFFYLPGSEKYAFSRSEVRLNLMFPVSPDYLQRCIDEAKASRLCGLVPEALQHLQWTIALFFGRNARNDMAWPSREDLEFKQSWLEQMITRGTKDQDRHKEELAQVNAELAKYGERRASVPAVVAAPGPDKDVPE